MEVGAGRASIKQYRLKAMFAVTLREGGLLALFLAGSSVSLTSGATVYDVCQCQ